MRTWICLLLFGCATPAPSIVPLPPTGWIDQRAYPISKAWVFAEDNENTRWTVVLASKQGYPSEFNGDLRAVHVDFGGESHSVRGIGGSPQLVYFTFDADRNGAAECAKSLGIEPRGRVDPRLVLRSRLEPASPAPTQVVRFVLENAGPAPFSFLSRGTGQGAGRDSRFQVTIERDGVLLPQLESPADLGGLMQRITLEPGASHSFELELDAWAKLDQPGLHRIRAQLLLEVETQNSQLSEPYDDAHLRWDATISAECELRIG